MQDSGGAGEGGQDAITRNTEDLAAGMQLTAYWEATGDLGDIDSGLCTPREVHPLGLDCPRKIIMCTFNTPDIADMTHMSAFNLDLVRLTAKCCLKSVADTALTTIQI